MVTNIEPIRDDIGHTRALKRLDELWNSEPGTTEAQEAELLTILIDDYENKHHAIPAPDPVETLKFMLDQEQITKAELAEYLGGPSKVSEVLSGERALSLTMIRKLHAALHIPAETLIRPIKIRRAKAVAKVARAQNKATGGKRVIVSRGGTRRAARAKAT